MNMENIFSSEIITTLNSLFSDGRCPHAVLIDGGSAEDRQMLSRLTAKRIVCGKGENSPCNECENCRKADENIHPDIITVARPDDKKFFVKSDVKNMVAEAYLTPNDALKKVYIISEIQQMNEESQNLLLKILEEPPHYTAFVLTSQNANGVIGTVLSRVVRLRLGKNNGVQFSENAVEVVKKLTSAVCSPYEYDKIQATASLDGNKKLTAEVLELMVIVLRDAVALKNGGAALAGELNKQSKEIADSNSVKNILDMCDVVCGLHRSLDNNPNYTLLSAVLCAKL